jgi:hypothetical protein
MNWFGFLGKTDIVDNFPTWHFQVVNPGFCIIHCKLMRKIYRVIALSAFYLSLINCVYGQDTMRERPEEWDDLVNGGRFMDRFLPIPAVGDLSSDTWGWDAVKPRYIDNGIEDNEWSYWGGNIRKGDDGKYHLIVCRWPENAKKGHMEWPNSELVHAVSEHPLGPYKVAGPTIGKGHNPEYFRLSDGRFVIYVYKAYYVAESLNGPWQKGKFEYDRRDRKIIDGLSNVSFAQREDGSFVAVCRGGGIWVSRTGLSSYNQITNGTVYPPYDGRYEDPVIWRTNIQYHMIVNDWYGRIAYYLRSKDGTTWKVEPGEAYMPGIARYEDGTVVDWYKYERIKVLQDEYGRAFQANFAVIDSSKWGDLGNDHHSSKNICLPLVKGRLLTILNNEKITSNTKIIRVKIKAENDFSPQAEVDIASLRFGASEEVNFGGGSRVMKTENEGKDLVVFFEGKGNGISEKNFAAKLIGKTNDGGLLFGYARLPWLAYRESILSARKPEISTRKGKSIVEFEVQNFGEVPSPQTQVNVAIGADDEGVILEGSIPPLKPYEKTTVRIKTDSEIDSDRNHIMINTKNRSQEMPLYNQKR